MSLWLIEGEGFGVCASEVCVFLFFLLMEWWRKGIRLIWVREELEAIRGDIEMMRGELRTVGNLFNKGVF